MRNNVVVSVVLIQIAHSVEFASCEVHSMEM